MIKTSVFSKEKRKIRLGRLLERSLVGFLISWAIVTFFGIVRQMVFYAKIKPILDQVEIGAMILFTTNLNSEFLELILCAGFLLIYLSIKNKNKEV